MKTTRLRWIFVSYVTLLHILVGILCIKTDFIPKLWVKLRISESTEVTKNDYFNLMLTFQQRMDKNVPNESVIFLGDSITQGLAAGAVTPRAVNYGIGGQTTRDLTYAIPHYRSSLSRAKGAVLAIGINDFITGIGNGFTDRITNILALFPEEKPLVISAILPVRISPEMEFSVADIAMANHAIMSACKRRGKCIYVDASQALADSKRQPRPEYYLDDGIHLNSAGYQIWIAYLEQALQQLQTM